MMKFTPEVTGEGKETQGPPAPEHTTALPALPMPAAKAAEEQPAVEEAPVRGQRAYYSIMQEAEQQAKYLLDSGNRTVEIADAFKATCLKNVADICDPVVEASLLLRQTYQNTAERVVAEAKKQAEAAVRFTKRLNDMSHAVYDTANGQHEDDAADKQDVKHDQSS